MDSSQRGTGVGGCVGGGATMDPTLLQRTPTGPRGWVIESAGAARCVDGWRCYNGSIPWTKGRRWLVKKNWSIIRSQERVSRRDTVAAQRSDRYGSGPQLTAKLFFEIFGSTIGLPANGKPVCLLGGCCRAWPVDRLTRPGSPRIRPACTSGRIR